MYNKFVPHHFGGDFFVENHFITKCCFVIIT